MNSSVIDQNHDTGINITYGGGLRIINRTSVSYNLGNGINVTLNETHIDNKTRYAKHQFTEVFFSDVNYNDGHGIRVGNFCQKGQISINDTKFMYNKGNAVDLTSCFEKVSQHNVTNMTVAYNRFDGNHGHAIVISPRVNAGGRIAYNTFTKEEDYLPDDFDWHELLITSRLLKLKPDHKKKLEVLMEKVLDEFEVDSFTDIARKLDVVLIAINTVGFLYFHK